MNPSPPSLSVIVCSAARPHLVAGSVASLLDQTGWLPGDEVLVVLNGAGQDEARALVAHEVRRNHDHLPGNNSGNEAGGETNREPSDKRDRVDTDGEPGDVEPDVDTDGEHDGETDGVERTRIGCWTLGVHRSEERGISPARNRGAGLARSEVLLYLDDDARPRPGWLHAWRAAFAADPDLAAAGGPIHAAWPGATPRWFHPRIGAYWSVLDAHDDTTPVPPGDRAYAANMAVRAEAVAEVGGFRTDIGWGGPLSVAGEEADLLIRLHAAGRRLGWIPDAAVDHLVEPDRTGIGYLVRRAFAQGGTDIALGAARPAPWVPLTTGWRSLIRSLGREPRSWRATAAVDLARRVRLVGRWRAPGN